jgi:hypothetical protein
MDDFDRFWQWANKPRHSRLTIPAGLHHAVTSLPQEAWRDRAKVNEAARLLRETSGGNTALRRP